MASEAGVVEDPTSTSTFSSSSNLRAFATARVASAPSSSTMYSTSCPAMLLGSSAMELRCGMPSEAAGPVVEMVTPTLMVSAAAEAASAPEIKPATARATRRRAIMTILPRLRAFARLRPKLRDRVPRVNVRCAPGPCRNAYGAS